MSSERLRRAIEKAITETNGILRLEPAWVARDFLPPGKRFRGLPEKMYHLGKRGGICERWLGSTTAADNKHGVPFEGLSVVDLGGGMRVTLKEAIEILPALIMGRAYARTHSGLGRLAKIFDYKYRLPYHIHQMKKHARLVGRNPKEEAYFFPEGVDMGVEPETYFGVHPCIAEQNMRDMLLPYLVAWNSDLILRHAKAYKLVPGDGWHVPAGILHAPGSAVTIELQEDSDVFAMMQAKTGGRIIDKELLFKDVRPQDRRKYGERIILDMIDWKANGDPFFFENHHTPPVLRRRQAGGKEFWIFYNTRKFSGTKVVVSPARKFTSLDNGVYNVLVWNGAGRVDGTPVKGGDPRLDELLIVHERATKPLIIENTGRKDLVLFKFFGPDVNSDVPMLKKYS